ncbi:MAG TPA: uroporphyrinogen decarboxylase family protein [Candidatus Brocadiia bacterium]|nr:uroporphyrinogen decarboxylase family protein [Candidatus Brocadiia bacterium]
MPELNMNPLVKEEVIAAIERKFPSRIPLVMAKWWGEGLWEQYGERLRQFDRIPDDVVLPMFGPPMPDPKDLSWFQECSGKRGHDSGGLLPDWKGLDEFIAKMPDPEQPGLLDNLKSAANFARENNRYLITGWWGLFFERPWGLRGMQNLFVDYYEYPDEIHRLHNALCDQYVALIRRAAREMRADGFWTSDDLGNQRQLMMKPQHFREFLKPYYKRVGDACRECGMHFWLHSCGDNTEILDDLIEVGVDVFHPVQKHTMDEKAVASAFGDRMTFLVGFDVQHILQEGTPDEVRAEVRSLMDTFDRPDGGMCLAAGNGIVAGTPFENIEAFLDEALRYGSAHRKRFKSR